MQYYMKEAKNLYPAYNMYIHPEYTNNSVSTFNHNHIERKCSIWISFHSQDNLYLYLLIRFISEYYAIKMLDSIPKQRHIPLILTFTPVIKRNAKEIK